MHIDLEVDEVATEGDTVLELPLDELEEIDEPAQDTVRMPL